MDDIGCGAETYEQMIPTLRQTFNCFGKSGLQLTPQKCGFGMTSLKILGNAKAPQGLHLDTEKLENLLKTLRLPAAVRRLKRLVGFVLLFRSIFPTLAQNIMPWYKLLRKGLDFELQYDHLRNFDTIKSDLLQAAQTPLRQAKPRQQYVIPCDASYYSSGFVLKIEDYPQVEKSGRKKHMHQFHLVHSYSTQAS